MSTFLRRAHQFSVGFQLASMILFAYAGLWFFVGWSALFGAISTTALWQDRKRKGIRA